ncbi:hypothetical protein CEV34_0499 [Brucella pseudogrignonensis]|uniref:Uncharacterized protein n=1 Tax=Brucella pseudogrignonensis TaxID=419475 RepID=A0A256GSB5_9HYPH|nr:hypothetical protein CEV34_0499 [Brucella pseudogrignonensis]
MAFHYFLLNKGLRSILVIWLTNSMDKQKPPGNPSGFELRLHQKQNC